MKFDLIPNSPDNTDGSFPESVHAVRWIGDIDVFRKDLKRVFNLDEDVAIWQQDSSLNFVTEYDRFLVAQGSWVIMHQKGKYCPVTNQGFRKNYRPSLDELTV